MIADQADDASAGAAQRLRAARPVAGVVDGTITVSTAQDGTVSLHIHTGRGEAWGRTHIEVVVAGHDAAVLQEALNSSERAGRGSGRCGPGPIVPCCVGIRLRVPEGERYAPPARSA